MAIWNTRSRALKALFLVACAANVSATSPSGDDPRIQDRLYEHLEAANRAYLYGHTNEATAYAEMVLLKRAIKINVDDSNLSYNMRENANRALRDAIINWEDALDRQVKFTFVSRRDADVVVSYTGDIRHEGKDAAGTVRWTRQVMSLGSEQYDYKVTATIVLRSYTPRGAEMNYRQMLHTAGHELGHVLGLEDSSRQGDLMGPLRLDRPVERATSNERESLIALRSQADLILRQVNGEELPTPSPAPQEEQVVPSVEAEPVETGQVFARNNGDRRSDPAVRRPVRNKKAPRREIKFAIGGMADWP